MIDPGLIKAIAGLGAFCLGAYAFGSYALKVRAGTVKPHPFSWVIWGFSASLATFVQLLNGAGFATLSVASTAIGCVAVLGFTKRSDWGGFRKNDWVNLCLAVVALVAWQVADSAEASVVLLSVGLLMGMITTATKSFNSPFTESQALFVLSAAKQVLALVAVSTYGFVTIYPAVFAIVVNLLVYSLITVRRAKIAPGGKTQLALVGP